MAAWLALGAVLLPGRADAEVAVLLLRPVPTSEVVAEAIVRIKSELAAGGFEVAVADSERAAEGQDPRALVEQAGRDLGPGATIGIFGDLEQGTAEIWVVDRIAGKTTVQRLEVQTSADRRISEVLAIRVQELLRAGVVERQLQESRPVAVSPALPPEVRRQVKPAAEPRYAPWSLGIELGASAFGGRGGLGPSFAPTARLRAALGESFWVRLTALGLGTRTTVFYESFSASVDQTLLLLEGAAWLRPGRLVRPLLSLGLGAERVAVAGTASGVYRGEDNARWFFAGDAGVGVSLRLGAHVEVLLEGHALVTAPRPAVRFFDVEAAWVGQPTLLLILTLAGGA